MNLEENKVPNPESSDSGVSEAVQETTQNEVTETPESTELNNQAEEQEPGSEKENDSVTSETPATIEDASSTSDEAQNEVREEIEPAAENKVSEEVNSEISKEGPTSETASTEEGEEEAISPEVSAEESSNGQGAESTDGSSTDNEEELEEEKEEPVEEIDFSKCNLEELLSHIQTFSTEEKVNRFEIHLKPIKARHDSLFQEIKNAAKEKFLAEGNESDDFEFKGDETSKKFLEVYDLLKDRRHKHYEEQEKKKDANYHRKNEILEAIRTIIDGEETEASINKVRELQQEWKKWGQFLANMQKRYGRTTMHLLDRYYDSRSIYFELKDLDRKKNLKIKLEICEKAEALADVESIKDAVIALNDLHDEFKNVGPIPKDDQEEVWQRFKKASDNVYVKRKQFVEDLKQSLNDNLEKKIKIADEVQEFLSFDSDSISDWNKKTKRIQELQKRWEAIGTVPREKAKEVNKKFWGSFKQFFAHKSAFFKRLESRREENLELKRNLVSEVEELKENQDWNKTADRIKRLQTKWKEIGPVPEKFRNSIYQEFKTACDHFFDRKREQNKEQNQEFEENYQKKVVICNSIDSLTSQDTIDVDLFYNLIDQFNEIGFVPRNSIKKIQSMFDQAVDKVAKSEGIPAEHQKDLKMNVEISKLKGGPNSNRKIQRKENSLRRQISELENDINTWKTNMDFFTSSKVADQLKKDFEAKIEKAEQEVKSLRHELRVLNTN